MSALPSSTPELLTVAQVCGRIPGARGAGRVHPATVSRWIIKGCPSRCGRKVKLAATRAGGRWLVSTAALATFFAELADSDSPDPPPAGASSPPGQPTRASLAAGEELARRGA